MSDHSLKRSTAAPGPGFAALPRLPTQAFYAFYPAHILTLHFIDLYG